MLNLTTKKEAFIKPPFFISYLITDPKEFGSDIKTFSYNLRKSLNKYKVDIICFRDKETKNIKNLAIACLTIATEFHISKILINSNIELALELGFNGVHLNSTQFDQINFAKNNKLYTIISCHTEDEVKIAKRLNSDAITYSPIFYKENKGQPKGVKNLKNIINKYQNNDFDIIALGGIIDKYHINTIKDTNASGFASIRYFQRV